MGVSSRILSVVTPVYNVAGHVDHLETELSKLRGSDVQIILVDDGSTDGSGDALVRLRSVWDDIIVITCPVNRGAGVARNLGFPHATGRYTLFFDADDFLHAGALFQTIEILDKCQADASINIYDFIRDGDNVATGMNAIDLYMWKRRERGFVGTPFHINAGAEFLRFTNFPWNKLIRTDHYQRLELAPFFGETKVNNDIQGHWNILMNARRLILVDQKIVTHRMSGARDHLSSRFGRERLEIFDALQSLHATIKREPGRLARFGEQYWAFVRQMTNWAGGRLDGQYQPAFRRRRRDLVARVSFDELHNIIQAGEAETYQWLLNSMD